MNGTMQDTKTLAETVAELTFDHGIPGFAAARRFSLLPWGAEDGPFSLMKSLDDATEFLVATPEAFFPDYHPEIDDEMADWLGIASPEDGLVLVIVTVPEQAKNATANLLGPLIVNRETRRSVQAVMHDDYSTREPLFH